mmetsp:Transcript_130514/g.278922  ORF Transcript_130514/g.278922 Transcript_130514/m.278922 type:complete len:231 (-) Transcript_130514:281-973(-)
MPPCAAISSWFVTWPAAISPSTRAATSFSLKVVPVAISTSAATAPASATSVWLSGFPATRFPMARAATSLSMGVPVPTRRTRSCLPAKSSLKASVATSLSSVVVAVPAMETSKGTPPAFATATWLSEWRWTRAQSEKAAACFCPRMPVCKSSRRGAMPPASAILPWFSGWPLARVPRTLAPSSLAKSVCKAVPLAASCTNGGNPLTSTAFVWIAEKPSASPTNAWVAASL